MDTQSVLLNNLECEFFPTCIEISLLSLPIAGSIMNHIFLFFHFNHVAISETLHYFSLSNCMVAQATILLISRQIYAYRFSTT